MQQRSFTYCDTLAELGYELYKQDWLSKIPAAARRKALQSYYDNVRYEINKTSFEEFVEGTGYGAYGKYLEFSDFLEQYYPDETSMNALFSEKQLKQYMDQKERSIDPYLIPLRAFCNKYVRGDFESTEDAIQKYAGWRTYCCSRGDLGTELKEISRVVLGITDPDLLGQYHIALYNLPNDNGGGYDIVSFEALDRTSKTDISREFSVFIHWHGTGKEYAIVKMGKVIQNFDHPIDIQIYCNEGTWKDEMRLTFAGASGKSPVRDFILKIGDGHGKEEVLRFMTMIQDKDDAVQAARSTVEKFLETPAGRKIEKEGKMAGHAFTWADAAKYIPSSYWEQNGFLDVRDACSPPLIADVSCRDEIRGVRKPTKKENTAMLKDALESPNGKTL